MLILHFNLLPYVVVNFLNKLYICKNQFIWQPPTFALVLSFRSHLVLCNSFENFLTTFLTFPKSTDIELKVGVNVKIAKAVSIEILEATINHTFTPRRMDSDCGEVTLNYFDNPKTRLYFPNYGFYIDVDDEQ